MNDLFENYSSEVSNLLQSYLQFTLELFSIYTRVIYHLLWNFLLFTLELFMIYSCKDGLRHTPGRLTITGQFENSSCSVSYSEAVIATMSDEPNYIFTRDCDERACLLESIKLEVCKKIAYQLPSRHAKRYESIAFANRTNFNGMCN